MNNKGGSSLFNSMGAKPKHYDDLNDLVQSIYIKD